MLFFRRFALAANDLDAVVELKLKMDSGALKTDCRMFDVTATDTLWFFNQIVSADCLMQIRNGRSFLRGDCRSRAGVCRFPHFVPLRPGFKGGRSSSQRNDVIALKELITSRASTLNRLKKRRFQADTGSRATAPGRCKDRLQAMRCGHGSDGQRSFQKARWCSGSCIQAVHFDENEKVPRFFSSIRWWNMPPVRVKECP